MCVLTYQSVHTHTSIETNLNTPCMYEPTHVNMDGYVSLFLSVCVCVSVSVSVSVGVGVSVSVCVCVCLLVYVSLWYFMIF